METALEKRQKWNGSLTNFFQEWAILFIGLVLFFIASVFVDGFFASNNILNILRQITFLAIISLGQFLIILIGGMDMSPGSSIGLFSLLLAGLVNWNGLPIGLAIVTVLLISMLVGLINGLLTVYGKIPAFIATLGMMIALKGVNYLYSNGIPISGLPSGFRQLSAGYVGPIPIPVIILLVISIICWVFTMQTKTGRSFYAVGGNEEAAKLSGIRTNRIKILAFVLGSLLTAIGTILITSRTMAGQPALGETMLFDIITICVLGGTSLSGGRGKVFGVVIAAIILGIIDNMMVLLGIGSYWQWIIKGAILVSVVVIDAHSKKD